MLMQGINKIFFPGVGIDLDGNIYDKWILMVMDMVGYASRFGRMLLH